MSENIRDIALQAMQGSAPAFQELYRLTRQGAWFVALSITKNEHDAQDILQESYLKAYQALSQLAQPEHFSAWLNQIVANKAKNYVSRKRPDSFAQYEDESAENWLEETNPEFIPDERLDQAQAKELIASLVNELPEDQRLVVLLRYYDDMEVAAIAKSLEIPEGTVKSRLGRARQKLAAMLELAQGKGLKLYAAAPIPLLAHFIKLLGLEAPGSDRLPPLLIGSAAAGGAAAAGEAAKKAAKKAASAGKIAAIAATVVVAVGGITAVYAYNRTAPAVGTTAAATAGSASASRDAADAATEVRSEAVVTTQAPPDTRMTSARPLPQAPPAATTSPEVTQTHTSTATTTAAPTTARSTTTAGRVTWSYTPLPTNPPATKTTTQPTTTAATTRTTTQFIDTPRPPTTAEPTTMTTVPAVPDFEYAADPAGGCVVTKYNGSETDVTVPAAIDGVAVVHLGAGAFEGTNVVRVAIEPGFDCLRDRTFADCPDLMEVVVPDTVVNVLGSPFTGSPNVVVVCGENSAAHRYCRNNGIAFRLA